MQQLAADVVERALRAGATEAEVVIREGDEFSTLVRLGQVETLKESGARGIGLRVFLGSSGAHRTANTSTSDFSEAGLAHLVSGAIDLAQVTSEDPFAGLPEPGAMGAARGRPRSLLRRRLWSAGCATHRVCAARRGRGSLRRSPHRSRRATVAASTRRPGTR